MSNPNYPTNLEQQYEDFAQAVIDKWKSDGVTVVYRDSTRGVIILSPTPFRYELDDPEVKKEIILSMSRGSKYELD